MIGKTISHYHVLEKLGAGGMGVVYKAEDTRLQRFVALKVLPDDIAHDQQFRDRFAREARTASALNHPNICTIHDVGEENGQVFIAMEFLDGAPLSARIATGPLNLQDLLDVGIQVAEGLSSAHMEGIIHRDIKPGNIFITKSGRIKIMDFGLAKRAASKRAFAGASSMETLGGERDHITNDGAALGTLPYMSPEQVRGEGLDARTDLFSFGAVLYEMATASLPFPGATPGIVFDAILNRPPIPVARFSPGTPAELGRIIDKALEKDREMRYQHASEMRADLTRLKRQLDPQTSTAPIAKVPPSRGTLISESSAWAQAVEEGRESFRKQAWGDAFSQLWAADQESPLGPEDLAELAQAALLIGKEAEGEELLARAHQAFMSRGDVQLAARCAFWLGYTSLFDNEIAKANGWLARASRLLEDQPDCVEKGYMLLPTGYRAALNADAVTALSSFNQATEVGVRFRDHDLTTLGLMGQGRVLVRTGDVERGMAMLDEAMVAVTAGEISALNAGRVYCSVLEGCGEVLDLQRAQEWTSALERWCASQPDVVPFRGHCLIRRSELLQLHGLWPDALEQAQRANEWLSRPVPKRAVGAALYQIGELHRLRGNWAEAEQAYLEANQWRSTTGSGFARLRLAQGQVGAAQAAIRRAAEEVKQPCPRALVLDAYVEIALAAHDIPAARTSAGELAEIAKGRKVLILNALASRAAGAVLLAEGEAKSALPELRKSWGIWRDLQAPYEAARTRVLIALACRELGDEESALLELNAAEQTFQQLGAAIDLSRVQALLRKEARNDATPLSARELEVLRLVASGMTNREIADKLHISEKTVARHISNIFNKLDLSSRSAATAYAYDHKLV